MIDNELDHRIGGGNALNLETIKPGVKIEGVNWASSRL